MYAGMTLLTGVTQEIMEITNHKDRMIPTNIIKAIRETTHDQPVAFKYTIHETDVQVDCKTIHAIVLTSHAHQLVFALGD